MPHFFFFPPILDSAEAEAFLFCDFMEYYPRGEKKFAPFSYVCKMVVCCRRFGRTVGGGEILTAVLVKIQVIWDVSPCRLANLPSSSGPTVQDEGTAFPRNVRNPSPVDSA